LVADSRVDLLIARVGSWTFRGLFALGGVRLGSALPNLFTS
jgi:hypothetical protein